MLSVFTNDPFSILNEAFKVLFPNVKYEAYIRPSDEGYGVTVFNDDGSIVILISSQLPIDDAVELFAHELAHAGVGKEHKHDEVWEEAFDALFEEYNRIGDEMFKEET